MPQSPQRDTSWFGKTWPPWWGWWCSGLPTDSALSAAAPSAQSWTSSSRQETCEEKERKKGKKKTKSIYRHTHKHMHKIASFTCCGSSRDARKSMATTFRGASCLLKISSSPRLNLKMQSVPWDELLTEHLIPCPKWSRNVILGLV